MIAPEGECTECGRAMAKAKRVYKGGRYCPTCYKRWFVLKGCTQCGDNTRAHKHDTEPVCATCRKLDRVCIRCNRLTPVAGLLVEGKPVCPSCVPHFKEPKICPECGRSSLYLSRDAVLGFSEPVCERCRRGHHKTCSICRKYRPVDRLDENSRPICKKCSAQHRESHPCPECGKEATGPLYASCESCQIRKRLAKRFRLHLERLETGEGRKLFTEFSEWFSERPLLSKDCGRFDRNVDFFERIDREIFFGKAETLTHHELARVFTADQLRKAMTPIVFLFETRGISVDALVIEEATENRRIIKIINKAREVNFGAVIEKYHKSLLGHRASVLAPHTIRVYLRSALSFLEDSGVERLSDLSPDLVKVVLRRKPGLRASMGAFFFFLGVQYGLHLKPMKPRRNSARVVEKKMMDILRPVLLRLEHEIIGLAEKKALTAYVLSKLYGLPLNNVLMLRKRDLAPRNPVVLKAKGVSIFLNERLVNRLNIPQEELGVSKSFIFEGRVPGSPLSVGAVGYWVKSAEERS